MTSNQGFDWDNDNISHLARHNVTSAEFEQAMRSDPILFDYESVDGEDRRTGPNASKKNVRDFWGKKGQ